MSDQLEQLQTEDWVLFFSTVLGSAGMVATNNPSYVLYGLTLGAAGKSLMSLGTNWKSLEDWLMFGATFCGALGTSLSNNSQYMTAGLVLAAIGKALPSLAQYHWSVEDWLLLILPVATAIVWIATSKAGVAELGLFFGMLGKSLTSVNPASPAPPSSPQPPAGPSSGMSGNRNYILWNGCSALLNPSVGFKAATDVSAGGNWDLQVNAYSPAGTDAYMQFVLAVTTSGEVQWSIENWPISGSNLFNTCDQHLFQLPSSFLAAGCSIGLNMNTDPSTKNVTSVDFWVKNASGTQVAYRNVKLDATLPICDGAWKDSYLSQVIGLEPNIVGYNGGVAVSFRAGSSGTLECGADAISASTSVPSCAETKAGTVENSNMAYSVAVQATASLVTIGATAS